MSGKVPESARPFQNELGGIGADLTATAIGTRNRPSTASHGRGWTYGFSQDPLPEFYVALSREHV